MKEYFTLIISSAILAGIAECAAPHKWKKYLNAISGIMIASIILSPIPDFKNIDFFLNTTDNTISATEIQKNAVHSSLKKRIDDDITNRIKENLSIEITAKSELSLNDNGEIDGIEEITVWATQKRTEIKNILEKVYSPTKISFAE